MPTSPRPKQNGNIHHKPKPPTVGANTVRPQRAQPVAQRKWRRQTRPRMASRCEPYPPIQRREMISLTAAAAACSPLRGIPVSRYTMISPFRNPLRRGRCPHRPAPFYKPKPPPTVGANIVRPKVPLEKGDSPQCGEMSRSDKGDGSVRDVTVGDRGIPQGSLP